MKPASSTLIQSLGAVRGAVADALGAAAAALQAGGEGVDAARRQWRGAHAAMQLLNHRALLQFSTELGEQISEQRTPERQGAPDAAAFAEGARALKAYIDALVAGQIDQPLVLFPAYEALQRARGVAQTMPSELFFPDPSIGPGPRSQAPVLGGDDLRAARRTYEGGLLTWMRKGDVAALKPLSEVATRVEAAQIDAAARRPWWALRAVLDALQHDGLEGDALVRRVLTQMNLLLGRMVNGAADAAEAPDALTRDALYLAAKARPVTPLITGVQRVFGLGGALEVQLTSPLGFDREVAATALKSVDNLIDLWIECAAGHTACSEFAQRARALATTCEKLGVPALTALVTQLAASAEALSSRGASPPDAVALEVACALLMLEHVLGADAAPQAEFDARAAHMAMRVGISVESPEALRTMAPAQLLDEASRIARLAEPLALAHDEIARALHETELTLEAWFGGPRKPDAVAGLDKPLRQAAGALSLLGHAEAAEIARHCRAAVERHALGAPCGKAEQEALATRLTALTAYAEAAKQGAKDLRLILQRAGLVEAQPLVDVPEVPLTTAMIETGAETLVALPAVSAAVAPAAAAVSPPSLAFDSLEISGLNFAVSAPVPTATDDGGMPASAAEPLLPSLNVDTTAAAPEAAAAGVMPAIAVAAPADTPFPSLDLGIEFPAEPPTATTPAVATAAPAVAALPPVATVVAPAAEAPQDGGADIDAELLDIFLEEADEVLTTIADTVPKSAASPADGDLLTELRRAFHTLKGSGRMVGLKHFGEAAWEMEQVMNELNASGRPGTPELYRMLDAARDDFARWVGELRDSKSARIDATRLVRWAQCFHAGEPLPVTEAAAATSAVGGEAAVATHTATPAASGVVAPAAAALPAVDSALPMLTLDLPVLDEAPPVTAASGEVAVAASTGAAPPITLDLPSLDLSPPDLAPAPVEAQMAALATIPAAPAGDAPAATPETPPVVEANDTVQVGAVSVSRSLYEVMLPEAQEHAATLAAQANAIREQGTATYEAMRAAHTLRGISASARLQPIVALAGSLERVLQLALDSGGALPLEARAVAFHAVSALLEQIEALAQLRALTPHDALCTALDAVTLAPAAMPAPAVAQPLPPAASDTASEVLAEERPLAAGTEAPLGSATLDFSMSLLSPDSPVQPELGDEVTLAEPDRGDSVDRRQDRLKDDLDSQLLPIFLEEATELVPQVGHDLREWRARPGDKLVLQSLKRLLHTLKGSARMAGAMALGQLTHSMESRVENAELLSEIPPQLFDGLETSFDRIGVLIAQLQGDTTLGASVTEEAAPALPMPTPAADDTAPAAEVTAKSADTSAVAAAPDAPVAEPLAEALSLTQVLNATTAMPIAGNPPAASATGTGAPAGPGGVARLLIRVRADLIERLANQAGEVSITRARVAAELRSARTSLRDLSDNVTRLRSQLRELEIAAETQMQSRQQVESGADSAEFDPLEFDRFTRLQELTRLMAESVNDVATVQRNLARDLDESDKALATQGQITRAVQQDLLAIRMVPFSSLTDRLYRVARLSAKDNGKRVELEITGGHVDMDRSVIERVAAPLEHLLRNAIVHGIEASSVRRTTAKPEHGSLKLEARQEGNEVVLTLADDGAGLNIDRIREKAIALGLMRQNERLTEQQIGNFIFRSGFSTAGAVTADAGRGVGMDVVMSEITALGGRVGTAFQRGAGTTFTIHLPLTLSVLQAVVLRLGTSYFAVPTLMVEQVQRLRLDAVAALRVAGTLEWQERQYPFHSLGKLLGMEEDGGDGGYASVLLLRTGSSRAAVQVDDIVGGQEIVIKNVGAQLARVPGVTGAAVLGSGDTVLILNPVLLTQRLLLEQERARRALERTQGMAPQFRPPETPPAPEPERPKIVLVVDDSLTVRKITGRLLTREGYVVQVAKDGIEALEKMREALPDVMLTDVEMPRMDGFDLTRNVRADDKLKALPVIMITSRTADKHRQHASDLGVDVFLGKPYEEGELLGHIATLSKRKATV